MITNHKRARIVRYFVAFALAWLLAFVPLQTRSKHSSAAAASPATSEFFVTFNQVRTVQRFPIGSLGVVTWPKPGDE